VVAFSSSADIEVKVTSDVLTPFAVAVGLVVYLVAFGFGVALVVRGGYRWARTSTSSSAIAMGAGVLGGLVGLLGGWVIADVRVAWRARGRLLWLLASAAWAIAACVSGAVALDVSGTSQPNQSTWVAILEWSPAFPLVVTFGVIVGISLWRRRLAWDSAAVPQSLLWSSLALACLVAPKPN